MPSATDSEAGFSCPTFSVRKFNSQKRIIRMPSWAMFTKAASSRLWLPHKIVLPDWAASALNPDQIKNGNP